MNTFLFALFACGEKAEDTGSIDDTTVEDTAVEDTDTEDTSTEDTNTEDTGTVDALAIIGTYTDNWGGTQDITASTWSDSYGSVFHISQYSNEASFLLAQNDANNLYNPDTWSKFQWTKDANDDLYYCQAIFDAATEEDAMGANADAADLTNGCAGFGWTALRPELDLTGDFVDSWGTPHSINAFGWLMGTDMFHILDSSNEENWALAQNDANNAYNPDLFSKFEWTTDSSGAWFYCQSTYDAATVEDAKTASADATDLDAGCAGFSWSGLNQQ